MRAPGEKRSGFSGNPFAEVRHAGVSAVAFLLGLLVCGPAGAVTLEDAAGSYRVEPGSRIAFSVGQIGGGGISGVFGDFAGTFQLDGADINRSVVVFTLHPAAVSTGQERVDAFLRSPAVFDVAEHPDVTFRSISLTRTGAETAVIEGLLTARGKTAPATFDVTLTGGEGERLGFHVSGEIMRSPFGMEVGTPIYSNVVRFEMDLSARRQ